MTILGRLRSGFLGSDVGLVSCYHEAMLVLSTIMINTVNLRPLAKFWAELLGTEIASEDESFIWLEATQGQTAVAFQAVAEPGVGTRRLHLDLAASDPEAELARAVGLGASQLSDHWSGSFHWYVLADPEGNEFCIAPAHI